MILPTNVGRVITLSTTRSLLIILSLVAISFQQTILPLESNLPPGRVGIPYIQPFSIQTSNRNSNGMSIVNATNLPLGFSIEGSRLYGIPLRAENITVVLVIARNGLSLNNTRKYYRLIIHGITTSSTLPFTYANVPFTTNISYTGGLPPFTWTYSNNPPWLSINNSSLTGTPNKIGSTTFLITITDSQNNTYSRNWSIITQSNKLILSPLRIEGQINVPITSNFTAANGVPPYSYRFVDLPREATSAGNSLSIVVSREGSFLIGVFVTDASEFTNYFSVIVAGKSVNQSVEGFISSISTSYSDNGSGQRVTIYSVPPKDLVPGFSIQSISNRPSFTFNDIISKSKVMQQQQVQSLIRTATTINNRNPCPQTSVLSQGSGSITSINQSESTISINNNFILFFKNCTLQAFRGVSQRFEQGNFVTYQGIPVNNTIHLVSITNTS